MMTDIKTVKLNDWGEIHQYALPGWIFRGQRRADWELKSSLERCCDRRNIVPSGRVDVEKKIIREFRRGYHQFAQHIPDQREIVAWLSIMQHHGAPTRLLDFTYSAYIAAYFALEELEKNDECAIWAIDAPWALKQTSILLANGKRKASEKRAARRMHKRFMDDDEKIATTFCMMHPCIPFTWPINPFFLNQRLRVQQGVFLIQGDIRKTFAENLKAMMHEGQTGKVIKILIPHDKRTDYLRSLWTMNISRAALFPGLDGFAQSLGVNHSLFQPTGWDRDFKRE